MCAQGVLTRRTSAEREGAKVSHDAQLSEAAALVANSLRRPSLAAVVVSLVAGCLDALALGLAFWFVEFAAVGGEIGAFAAMSWAGLSGGVATLLLCAVRGYRLSVLRRFWRSWGLLAASAGLVGALGLLAGVWAGWAAVVVPALVAAPGRVFMALAAGWTLDCGLTERRAVIVGGGEEAARLIRGLAANPSNDIRICGMFDDRDDMRSPPVIINTAKLGTVKELISFCRRAEIDILIVALPLTAERRIREILDIVKILPIDVRISTYSSDLAFPRRPVVGGLVDVFRRPLAGWRWLVKRGVDLLGATAGVIILAPLLIVTACAIRLESPGPVFFRQIRHGYNNRPILVWKFRSMYSDQCDPTARRLVTRNDPRVTRIGALIRRWSIDELPQLINVLRGELSLVGPRPHAVEAVSSTQKAFEEIVDGYAARHRVPPGVTGWAQIHGWRGEVDDPAKLEARVVHDLYYIENWSLWLDLYILVKTPLSLLDTRGAY